VGDCVELVTGYGPTTVNLYEAYTVVSNGVVVDVWPVLARGYGALSLH
jgi:D-serine deaminase-like pyridoxal phosphate-dependent protein